MALCKCKYTTNDSSCLANSLNYNCNCDEHKSLAITRQTVLKTEFAFTQTHAHAHAHPYISHNFAAHLRTFFGQLVSCQQRKHVRISIFIICDLLLIMLVGLFESVRLRKIVSIFKISQQPASFPLYLSFSSYCKKTTKSPKTDSWICIQICWFKIPTAIKSHHIPNFAAKMHTYAWKWCAMCLSACAMNVYIRIRVHATIQTM